MQIQIQMEMQIQSTNTNEILSGATTQPHFPLGCVTWSRLNLLPPLRDWHSTSCLAVTEINTFQPVLQWYQIEILINDFDEERVVVFVALANLRMSHSDLVHIAFSEGCSLCIYSRTQDFWGMQWLGMQSWSAHQSSNSPTHSSPTFRPIHAGGLLNVHLYILLPTSVHHQRELKW